MVIPANPPFLAPPGAPGVYFTDSQSLEGILSPPDFARRLGLPQQAQYECQAYGCAIVEFPVAQAVLPPASYPGVMQGLTVAGAREWITQGNLALASTMVVTYIEPAGTRYYQLQL
jgi:hypothetical protein